MNSRNFAKILNSENPVTVKENKILTYLFIAFTQLLHQCPFTEHYKMCK